MAINPATHQAGGTPVLKFVSQIEDRQDSECRPLCRPSSSLALFEPIKERSTPLLKRAKTFL
jgi:hypothetical protein